MRGASWWWAAVAAAALSAASSGCATCKTPPPFFVEITAVRETNRGAATRVLVLQLKNLDAIQQADFDSLRKDPPGTLAETLVGTPVEIWVNANEVETKWVTRDKDARFVAALAVFQQPGKRWWSTHKLKPVGTLQCREVPVESFQGRRPYSSEEQMRFYLGPDEITTDEAAPPSRRPASSALLKPARKGSGA
ncbi:MAG TPA: type VI secretion system lipoprotein TssJ [Myxococcales bacterium]|nr:type VI secretion system lipoprotein TssJ [Myxococcales bacterium]